MHAVSRVQGNEVSVSAEDVALARLRDQVFHAIGRNLVTVQKIESMLRSLVTLPEFSGPASQRLAHCRSKEFRDQLVAALSAPRPADPK